MLEGGVPRKVHQHEQWPQSGHQSNDGEDLLRLRFVAAVIARCSGDKSDKEESAGGFRYYGDCALLLQRLMRRASGILTTGGVCRFIYPA